MTEFVGNSDMQAKTLQIIKKRGNLPASEAMNFGKVALYKSEYGKADTIGLLMLLVLDFNNAFDLDKRLSDDDCADIAKLLLNEYYHLSMAEIAVFLEHAKYGKYGKVYGRIGKDTFGEMLEAYLDERETYIESKRTENVDMRKTISQYTVENGKWVKKEVKNENSPANWHPDVLDALKKANEIKKPVTKAIEVDERSRDRKNKLLQIQELRTWFPKEMNKAYQAAEYAYDRWNTPCTVEWILSSRKVKLLIEKLTELKSKKTA